MRREGKINLFSFDLVNERGWTLLDLVCLKVPGNYTRTAKILRDAGLPANFPSASAYLFKDWPLLRALLESGKVNYNERTFETTPILLLMISDVRVEAELIEMVIDHVAEVSYPTNRLYSNAYRVALKSRKGNPLPNHIMDKIWARLSLAEQLVTYIAE